MNRGKIMDKRCPLAEGTKIYDQTNKRTYSILENKGQGALCLAYRAFYTDNLDKKHSVILKELYPVNLGISRTADGVSLDIPANQIHAYNDLQNHFLQAYQTQNSFHEQDALMNATSDSREIFFANNTHYAVMGIDAGDTYDRYSDNTCRELFEIAGSVARAVLEYHKKGYLHLDIKPDNFLVLNGTTSIKLIDFDSIHTIEAVHRLFPISYSIGYAAPEILDYVENRNAAKASVIGTRSDVYSVGAMIFNRLFGRFPDIDDQYPGRDARWEQWIRKCKLMDKTSPKLHWELKQLFHKTLRYHPEDRCDTGELVARLDSMVELAAEKTYLSDQNVCVSTNKANYVSRQKTLSKIREMLLREESHMVFLCGIGGSGKTEAAREYAEAYRQQYHTIQFVNYASSLKDTIISLNFCNYKRPEKQTPEKEYEHKKDELFHHDSRTLLIIDNFDEDLVIDEKRDDEATTIIKQSNADVLRDLAALRNAESGDSIHILITTRNQPSTGSYTKDYMPLENLSEPELTQLFFSINPHQAENGERHQLVHDLLQITSCHTMTVSLVASLSKEAEDYGEPGLEAICALLKEEGLSHLDGEVTYEKDQISRNTEAFTHLKTLFRFNKMSDEEKYVLSNMVLVPVTGIRKKEFSSWVLSDTVKSVRIPVEKLIRTGWIIETNDPDNSIHLHPLISEVVLDELKPEDETWTAFLQTLQQKMDEMNQSYFTAALYGPIALHTGEFLSKRIDSIAKADAVEHIALFLETSHLWCPEEDIFFTNKKSNELKIKLFKFLVQVIPANDPRVSSLYDSIIIGSRPEVLSGSPENYKLLIGAFLDLINILPRRHTFYAKICFYFAIESLTLDHNMKLKFAQKAIESQIELKKSNFQALDDHGWSLLWGTVYLEATRSDDAILHSDQCIQWLLDTGEKMIHAPSCVTPEIVKEYTSYGQRFIYGEHDSATALKFLRLAFDLHRLILPLNESNTIVNGIFHASLGLSDCYSSVNYLMTILQALLQGSSLDHTLVQTLCSNINQLCWKLSDPSKVLETQLQILEILLKIPPTSYCKYSSPLRSCCELICNNCLQTNDSQYMLKVMIQIQEIYEAWFSPDDPALERLFTSVSSLYERIGDQRQARVFKKKAQYVRDLFYIPNHPFLTKVSTAIFVLIKRLIEYSQSFGNTFSDETKRKQ